MTIKFKPEVEELLQESAKLGVPNDLLGHIFMQVHTDTIDHAIETENAIANSYTHAHESSVMRYR
ncbi:MAG: hypothetical protein PHF86_08880 [Candidatus Nanoarchaeia archaeon]|nr:hypothetical protein [Candidatus Nanoarchaeia archaeon]